MSDILMRFIKDPLGFVKRVFYKTLIGPKKYGRENDYDAAGYWDDRLKKYSDSLRGVGDEGKSDADNIREYVQDEKIFTDKLNLLNLDYNNIRVLDIGCGTGFYADILKKLGVSDYTGIDITDALFEKHKENLPDFTFIKKDFTTEKHEGQYDLIIMIEVLEHIVNDEKFVFAMNNIKNCMAPKGVFVISSVWQAGGKHMFYVRKWTLEEIQNSFKGYKFSPMIPFRSSNMILISR